MSRDTVCKLRSFPLAAITLLLAAGPLHSAVLGYEFSGAVGISSIPEIPVGAPVHFNFYYDPNWEHVGAPDVNAFDFHISNSSIPVIEGTIGDITFQGSSGFGLLGLNLEVFGQNFDCKNCDSIQFIMGVDNGRQAEITLADADRSNGLTLALPNPLPTTGWELVSLDFFNADTSESANASVHFIPECAPGWTVFGSLAVGYAAFQRRSLLRNTGTP